jgi:succinyl-diaminopimelate desuccinylase
MTVIDLLERLIAIDTTSGTAGEVEGFEFVASWWREKCPSASVSIDYDGDRPTALLVTSSSDRPLLLFASHIDVVPVAASWESPPFTATHVEGRIVGRGSSDMKSGLAASMVATLPLIAAGSAVAFGLTTGEEIGCLGAPGLARLLADRTVGAVVIPESTENRVVCGHRGATWVTVETAGVAAHGSTPERGTNAIVAMAALLLRLDELSLEFHPFLGRESVSIGTIAGGSAPNIVADHCEISIDLRVVDRSNSLVAWWEAQPEVARVRIDLELDAVWTSPDDAFVTGLAAPVASAPASYFTDASVLRRALGSSVPIVIWGPGDPHGVHAANESVAIDAVHEAVELYSSSARRWVLGDRSH